MPDTLTSSKGSNLLARRPRHEDASRQRRRLGRPEPPPEDEAAQSVGSRPDGRILDGIIRRGIEFPYVHDLKRLLPILDRAGAAIPEAVRQAVDLTDFPATTRYPGMAEPVAEREYQDALNIAEAVVQWAEGRP